MNLIYTLLGFSFLVIGCNSTSQLNKNKPINTLESYKIEVVGFNNRLANNHSRKEKNDVKVIKFWKDSLGNCYGTYIGSKKIIAVQSSIFNYMRTNFEEVKAYKIQSYTWVSKGFLYYNINYTNYKTNEEYNISNLNILDLKRYNNSYLYSLLTLINEEIIYVLLSS